jgi:hypothetical protein
LSVPHAPESSTIGIHRRRPGRTESDSHCGITVRPSSHDTEASGCGTLGIGLRRARISRIAVPAPLAHISGHVVDAEFICRQLSHRMLGEKRISLIPSDISDRALHHFITSKLSSNLHENLRFHTK